MASIFELFFPPNPKKRGPDRRKRQDPAYGGPERRSGVDRRGFRYGLKFTTGMPIGPIQVWLDERLPNLHRLNIEGMSDDLNKKEVKILFANEGHREEFKAVLADYLGVDL